MAFLTNLLTLLIDICRHLLNWLLLTFHYRLLWVTILNRRYRRGYFCGQDWLVLWVFWFLTSIASFAVIIGRLSYLLKQICDELVSRCLRETCRNLTVLWSKLFNLLIGWLSYLLCRLIRLFISLMFEPIGLRLIWGSSEHLDLLHSLLLFLEDICPISGHTVRHWRIRDTLVDSVFLAFWTRDLGLSQILTRCSNGLFTRSFEGWVSRIVFWRLKNACWWLFV